MYVRAWTPLLLSPGLKVNRNDVWRGEAFAVTDPVLEETTFDKYL